MQMTGYELLANYEKAEDQGLLLRLPCKVGDTIYEVSYENRKYIICEHIVNQFVYIAYKKPRIEIYCEGENGFLSSSITGQLDDGLFLNREEAESKLSEMADAEFRRMRRNKTFRDMDENRRKGLYPICPKCSEVIDPVDIRHWTAHLE